MSHGTRQRAVRRVVCADEGGMLGDRLTLLKVSITDFSRKFRAAGMMAGKLQNSVGNIFSMAVFLIVVICTLGGCAANATRTTSQPEMSYYDREMLRAGNTYCRFLAASLAQKEEDREFGGYDPLQGVANGKKAIAWLNECRPILREVWEWKHINITSKVEGLEDERLIHDLMNEYFELYRDKIEELSLKQELLIKQNGLVEKYR